MRVNYPVPLTTPEEDAMAAKAKAGKSAKTARAGLKAAKVDVWVATIQDRAGGAADRKA